ncbi:MAG: hypothetical protein ACE5H9_21730 [Anaerolineae bacterium]
MTPTPIFRSPIAAPERPVEGGAAGQNLALADLTGAPVILIQGRADRALKKHFASLPANPGNLTDLGDGLLARLRPDQLYLFGKTREADLPSASTLEAGLAGAKPATQAIDFTHGKAVLRLVGPAAPEMLGKVCGLDFREAAFPTLQVRQTSAARIKTLIARFDEGDTVAYYLHVDRPLGQYFWEVVWDAGQEFGMVAF